MHINIINKRAAVKEGRPILGLLGKGGASLNNLNVHTFKRFLGGLATYVIMFGIAYVFLYPLMYIVITSLKSNSDLYDITVVWVPRTIKYQNYLVAMQALNYFKYLNNSALITIVGTMGHLMACSFIGYGFARYKVPGRNILFFMVIITIVVPVQTLIIPQYMVFANLKWLNSYLPILVPTFFGFGLKGGLFIFLFRQYYMGLPPSLEDAAKIDGCGFLKTYIRIVLPIAKSTLLVTLILSMVWHWNDYFEPAIYASKPVLKTLPSVLNNIVAMVNDPPEELFQNMNLGAEESVINEAVLMAGVFCVILPIILAFSFLQKQFMQGIERTGLVE